jgi:hypothetical protein
MDRGFVAVSDVPADAIPDVIAQHLEPLTSSGQSVESTCPFFGGLILEVGGRRALYPQCCGDLSAISSWEAVLHPDFSSGFVATEGHPYPKVIRRGDRIEVNCPDGDERFSPPVDAPIVIAVADFTSALDRARGEMDAFASRIEKCEPQRPHIARLLVFGLP